MQYRNLLFCSSCCEACFPSIVRPMRSLWELTLKIFDSPEMNRSIFFSMYFLWVTKKMNYFLRYLIFGERIFLSFVVLLLPLIGLQNLSHPVVTLVLSSWSSGISVSLLFKFITNLFDPEKFWPKGESCLCSKTKFWSQRVTGCSFQHGSNFGVSLDPSS